MIPTNMAQTTLRPIISLALNHPDRMNQINAADQMNIHTTPYHGLLIFFIRPFMTVAIRTSDGKSIDPVRSKNEPTCNARPGPQSPESVIGMATRSGDRSSHRLFPREWHFHRNWFSRTDPARQPLPHGYFPLVVICWRSGKLVNDFPERLRPEPPTNAGVSHVPVVCH